MRRFDRGGLLERALCLSLLLPAPAAAQFPELKTFLLQNDAVSVPAAPGAPARFDEPLTLADDAAGYFDQRARWKAYTAAEWRTCSSPPQTGNHWVKSTTLEILTDARGGQWSWARGNQEHIPGYESLNRTVYSLCLAGRWIYLFSNKPIKVTISGDLKEVAIVTLGDPPWPGATEWPMYWRVRADAVAALGPNRSIPSLQKLSWLGAEIQEKDKATPTAIVSLDLDPSRGLDGSAAAMALKNLEEEALLGTNSPFRKASLRVAAGRWLQKRLAGAGASRVSLRAQKSQLSFMGEERPVLEVLDQGAARSGRDSIGLSRLKKAAAGL